MKISFHCDSVKEFVQLILDFASIDMRVESRSCSFNVAEVRVGAVVYSITEGQPPYLNLPMVVNYMLNKIQRENDSIFLRTADGSSLCGSQEVCSFFNNELPERFVLRVGWRTDYQDLLFSRE